MKKIITIITVSLLFLSCSDDNSDCLAEKQEIIERYDKSIEESVNVYDDFGNLLVDGERRRQILINEKLSKLAELGC